jgi:SAM-dependent methyltransferase
MQWSDLSTDPNSDKVLQYRQEALIRAWRSAPPENRLAYIVEQCRDRAVLDVGCAGHGGDMERGGWLHARIQDVAAECLGIDVNKESVKRAREYGFYVQCFDILSGSNTAKMVLGQGRFDVMVAGEVIEHLRDPLRLLEVASTVLKDTGKVIITTPNPYAPHRVFAGRTRYVWENADHLFYIFPSGMVEMAERTGFQLVEWCTVGWDDRWSQLWHSIRHWVRALWHAEPSRAPIRRPAWIKYVSPLEACVLLSKWKLGTMGETAIYMLQKNS